jgi:basic amino acid/polyamine antiporter, APA family
MKSQDKTIMLKNLLAVKSIQDLASESNKGELRRSLGPVALTAIGIGGIIGTGIFVLTGLAAAQHAGPAIVLSFIIAGIGCIFAGLCYAEFASMIPVSGSAYAYSYATLGEGVAWFIGWNLILEYLFAASTVSVGWSRYLIKLLEEFNINFIPAALSSAPIDYTVEKGFFATGAMFNLPAVLIVTVVTVILMLGIRQSSLTNAIVVAIKVAIVVLVIGFGAFYVTADNWHPFIPENTGVWGQYGPSGILRASGIIFFAYIGFDAVSTAAQEAKNPQRDVPTGILASLVICTILYILMSGVLTGMLAYPKLNDAAPVAAALQAHPELRWLTTPVIFGALAGLTSVILVMMLAQSRIFYSMSRDGLLPPRFRACHPQWQTPVFSTVLTGVGAGLMGGLLPLNVLGELVSSGTLLAFVTVCIGIMVLRVTKPDLPRPFKVKGVWFVGIGGTLFCGVMLASLFATGGTWYRIVGWTIVGFLVYFGYGYKNSALRNGSSHRPIGPATTQLSK